MNHILTYETSSNQSKTLVLSCKIFCNLSSWISAYETLTKLKSKQSYWRG